MAIQKGSIILEGQIGNLSFYRSNGKPQVRQHSGVSKDRITKDPRFARTRENNLEFGRASNAAKLIRVAVRRSLGDRYELFKDPGMVNRLSTRMGAIIRADVEHERGNRIVQVGNLGMLSGFGFTSTAALKDVLLVPPRYVCQWDKGIVELALPGLRPDAAMAAPRDAVLCSFHVTALSFNESYEWLPIAAQHHELLSLDYRGMPPQSFSLELPGAPSDALIICFGISFYKTIGGYPVPIIESGRNVLEVIGVEGFSEGHPLGRIRASD
ncbi:hypothetical protein ACFOET_09565 [Parapedobacter deserti]|uniref:Uncharacterized protein n=1 Tax=Parapedobacter deserti TaxID=1912957 RepID=A0ABV7JIP8_9SPHI